MAQKIGACTSWHMVLWAVARVQIFLYRMGEEHMTTAFDYKGQPSIWTTDKKLKRFKQGEDHAKKLQEKQDINYKNQVFIYSKALSSKK
jgi:hypothetical protein